MKLCDGRRDNTGGAGDSSWNLRMRSGLHAPPWERPGGKRARVTDGAQNGAPSPCGGWAGFESGSSAAIGASHTALHTRSRLWILPLTDRRSLSLSVARVGCLSCFAGRVGCGSGHLELSRLGLTFTLR